LEDAKARAVVAGWSGGGGVVPRGPKELLSVVPATPAEVERHTGRRASGFDFWRLEVSGRFLAAAGMVYPGGVPYPEDLHNEMPIVANEVWLYADEDGRVVGTYWWPDAVRKPIASVPRDEYAADAIVHPDDAASRVDVRIPLPTREPWRPAVAVCLSRSEVLVFCVTDAAPDPLNEMLVYEHGGISVRVRATDERPDTGAFLRSHQPPYRRVQVRLASGVARDPGRALGPQTWPWPGELSWWEPDRTGGGTAGLSYEVRGSVPVTSLVEIAESI
jgi:hypothetical protein